MVAVRIPFKPDSPTPTWVMKGFCERAIFMLALSFALSGFQGVVSDNSVEYDEIPVEDIEEELLDDIEEELLDDIEEELLDYNIDENYCPSLRAVFLAQSNIPWGVSGRAFLTIPKEVQLVDSTIPGAGLGIVSKTFISKYTWLAEYEGDPVPAYDKYDGYYSWQVSKNGRLVIYTDGHRLELSNWLRWINCPRNTREENVMALQCKGKVFYVTFKDLVPGQELLVYYGDGFARDLNIEPLRR